MSKVVALFGDQRAKPDVDQEWVVEINKKNQPEPKFFNNMSGVHQDADFLVYVPNGCGFASAQAGKKMVKILEENPIFGVSYSNSLVISKDEVVQFQKILPSFNSRMGFQSIITNSPMVIRTEAFIPFDEELSILFMWDVFRKHYASKMMVHIPEFLCTSLDNTNEDELKREYEIIKKK